VKKDRISIIATRILLAVTSLAILSNLILPPQKASADPPLPDLVVTENSGQWQTENSTYLVHFTVKNQGGASASPNTVSIMIDGIEMATDNCTELAAGATYSGTAGPFTISGNSDVIRVRADSQNAVTESNEDNNSAEESISIIFATLNVSPSSATVSAGESFTVAIMINTDFQTRGAQCGLSFDPDILRCDGITAGTFYENWANQNGAMTYLFPMTPDIDNENGSAFWSIALIGGNNGGPSGTGTIFTYEFTALANGTSALSLIRYPAPDYTGIADEVSILIVNELEINDSSVTVEASGALPDLVITEKSEQWVQTGSTYNITFTVKNQGEGPSAASIAGVYIDDVLVMSKDCPALAAAESETITVGPFNFSGDTDKVEIRADKDNLINETDENNNVKTNTFRNKPNLEITNITPVWEKKNETFKVTYTIKNSGSVAAGASSTTISTGNSDGSPVQVERECPALEAGQTFTETTSTFIFERPRTIIQLWVDTTNSVAESNESDNTLAHTLQGLADLAIDEVTPIWQNVNSTYKVTFTVKNRGYSSAQETVAGVYLDAALAATANCTALEPDGSVTLTVGPFTLTGTSDYIKVIADKDNIISEANETNNVKQVILNTAADLVISNLIDFWVTEDKTYKITYTITNDGANMAASSKTAVYIDGNLVTTEDCPSLAAGAMHKKTLGPFSLSGGFDVIKVVADTDNKIVEANEWNNMLEIVRNGLPDLVITEAQRVWRKNAGVYDIVYTVKNQGVGNSGACFTAVYIDGSLSGSEECPPLPAGGSYVKTTGPFTLSDGTDTIKLSADTNDDIAEKNESNNELELTISGKSDLIISKHTIRWLGDGLSYMIDYALENKNAPCEEPNTIEIYIDSIKVATEICPALPAGGKHTGSAGPFVISGDSDFISIRADTQDVILEDDENNNRWEEVIRSNVNRATSSVSASAPEGTTTPELKAMSLSEQTHPVTIVPLSPKCDINGIVQADITSAACNGDAFIRIKSGTIALRKDGSPIADIEVQPAARYPLPTADKSVIGLAYGLGPNGSTFNPPISLTLKYDPKLCPEGVLAENLSLAFFDTEVMRWVELDSTVDQVNNTVTAEVSHFTLFAVIASASKPAIRWSLLGIILMAEVIAGMIVVYIVIKRKRYAY